MTCDQSLMSGIVDKNAQTSFGQGEVRFGSHVGFESIRLLEIGACRFDERERRR
jgi:hypothetical protein